MILISHRGNINGKKEGENEPRYVFDAMDAGYNVEVDIWYVDNKLYLGHDKPQYHIQAPFIGDSRIWCHAKNLEAIVEMKKFDAWYLKNIHYFWHRKDDVTLTSRN